MDRLNGRVALVTGAGRGIGRAIAGAFVREGAAVVVNDLDPDQAVATAIDLSRGGGCALPVPGDVADERAVRALLDESVRAYGKVDILVNNAGISNYAPVIEMSSEVWDRMIAVHLRGTFLCTRYALPHMLAARSGKVINIASQRGQKGGRDMAHYCAAKAGIIGFTKAVALEVAAYGVNVNAIAPGPIRTGTPDSPRFTETVRGLPIGRAGTAEEVAVTAVFLASDEANFYVGQTLSPNGGDVML